MKQLIGKMVVPTVLAVLWAPFLLLVVWSGANVATQYGATMTTVSSYALLMKDTQLRAALLLSCKVATLVAIISATLAAVVVGIGRTAQAKYSSRFRPLNTYMVIIGLGLGLPEIALGLSSSMLLTFWGVDSAVMRLTTAHLFLGISAAFGIVLAGSAGIPLSYEIAARDCGASLVATAVRITGPLHTPLLGAAFVTAWLLSFEDLAIAFFVSPPGEVTLPQYIFGLFRFRRLPEAYALGTIMVLAALLISPLFEVLLRRALPRKESDYENSH